MKLFKSLISVMALVAVAAVAVFAAEQTPQVSSVISDESVKPAVLVIPETNTTDPAALATLEKNPLIRAAMDGVHAYLAKNGYVIVKLDGTRNYEQAMQEADICIKFMGIIDRKGNVSVRLNAFDAVTSRNIGTKEATVNSLGRNEQVDKVANLKTAAKKAMPGLESQILPYLENQHLMQ